jgi:hypothetical protein
MCFEKQFDDLIEAGWDVIDSDFDPVSFHHWRKQAAVCLSSLLGPDHIYVRYFSKHLQEANRDNLVVGEAILVAAGRELRKRCRKSHSDQRHDRLEGNSKVHTAKSKGIRRGKRINHEPQIHCRPTSSEKSLRVRGKRRIGK